jgi:glycosyltransferase involved in cell wall biosynthesis
MNLENIIIGIDAVNIRQGGGITHLRELLDHADPSIDKFSRIILWSSAQTLNQIKEKPWLIKKDIHKKSFFKRTLWQLFFLSKEVERNKCDILFVPGGSFTTKFKPIVTMNHNLLPFQFKEFMRYGFSFKTLKFLLLFFVQKSSFNKSDGIIFLTNNARNIVSRFLSNKKIQDIVINHGIEKRFFFSPDQKNFFNKGNLVDRLNIIIVSAIEPYKHHANLIKAISELKKENNSMNLFIFGSGYKPSIKALKKTIKTYDPDGEFIFYKGPVDYSEIEETYKQGEIMLFSSSCETFGQTLTEGMAGSLAIASSNIMPMPELLGNAGIYFDPFDSKDIKLKIQNLVDSPHLRNKLSSAAYDRALEFSWYDCARETFKFIRSVEKKGTKNVKK